MDFSNYYNSVASYPSGLVNRNELSLSGTLQTDPNNERVQADSGNDVQKRLVEYNEGDHSEEPEQKRQRTQTNDEAREQAQQRLMEAINLEAQKIHGADAQVFPNHLLQPNKPAEGAPAKRGRGRPRINPKPSINFLVPTPSGGSQPRYVAASPSRAQQPQAVTAAAASGPHQSLYPQVQYYSNLPVPRSYLPTIPFSSPASSRSQQGKQSQSTDFETSSPHLAYSKVQHTPGPPVGTAGEHSQYWTPLPASATSTAGAPQRQASIASPTIRGTSTPQQKDLPRTSATVPTSGGSQPYPFGPYPSYPDSLTSTISSTPTADVGAPKAKATPKSRRAPRQTTTQPANRNSPASIASGSTPHRPYSTLQPAYGAPVPILGDIQLEGVRTPQKSFFQQGWGPLGLPALTPPNNLGANNGLSATTNSASVTPSPAKQHRTLAPLVFENPTPTRRVLSPMDYRAITEAANKALAAHGTATPAASRTPYPPPQDGDDLQHAGGRITHTWDQAKTIYLKIDQATRVNEYVTHDQVTQTIQALVTYPIDWDLAFYHSEKLAWYYSDNNGQLPSNPYPIKVSFPATGYALINWFFKQAIYPLPLFAQEPVFPQQGIPDEQTLLVDLWICATDLQIPKLQNLALNELDRVRNVSAEMSLTALSHTYNRTKEGSILRQYLVWQYANRLSEAVVMEPRAKAYYPHDFLQEWVMMLTQMWKSLSGRNDVKVDLNLEDFMVREKEVTWPFEEVKMD